MKLATRFHIKHFFLLYLAASFLFVLLSSSVHVGVGGIILASAIGWVNITVTPTPVSGNYGDTFTIDINIVNVTDLWAWDIKLEWYIGESMLLECTDVHEGSFLKQGGLTFFSQTIKNGEGRLFAGALLLSGTPVSGSGVLASATFQVTDAGSTTLELYDTVLSEQDLVTEIDHTNIGGYFYTTRPKAEPIYDAPSGPYFGNFYTPNPSHAGHPIVGEALTFNGSACYDPDDPYDSTPGGIVSYSWDFGDGNITSVSSPAITHRYRSSGIYTMNLTITDDDGETDWESKDIEIKLHDIAIVDFAVNSTEVLSGDGVSINVTVSNEGSTADSFNITVYYIGMDVAAIEMITKKDLVSGQNATLTFEWNTTSVTLGTYTLYANAYLINRNYVNTSLADLEEDMTDNMLFGDNITIAGAAVHDISITRVAVDSTNLRLGSISNIMVTVKNEGNKAETNVNVNVTASNATGVVYETQRQVNLTAGASQTLYFSWFNGTEIAQEGDYNITAEVPPISGETDTADNTYPVVTVTIRLLPVANFTYSPSEPSLGEVVIFNASASYAPGTPEPGEPAGTIIEYVWNFGDGNVTTISSSLITHIFKTAGEFLVRVTVTDNDGLSSSHGEELTFALVVGHDIVTANVTFSPNSVIAGEFVAISATIENAGEFVESFIPVKAYFSTNVIGAQTLSDLEPGAKTTLQFSWNTTGVAEGNYFIMVLAGEVAEEADTENNRRIGGIITIEKVTVDISANPTTIVVGETAVISGSVQTAQGPLAAVEVTIWYMPSGGSWNFLATVITYANGQYSFDWQPRAGGAYAVKASWPGDTSLVESDVQIVTAQETPTPTIFLYTTAGLGAIVIFLLAVIVYFLRIRKAK